MYKLGEIRATLELHKNYIHARSGTIHSTAFFPDWAQVLIDILHT